MLSFSLHPAFHILVLVSCWVNITMFAMHPDDLESRKEGGKGWGGGGGGGG